MKEKEYDSVEEYIKSLVARAKMLRKLQSHLPRNV